MKTIWLLLITALTLLSGASRSLGYEIEAVDAVSRQYLLVNDASVDGHRDAVSRALLMVCEGPGISYLNAVSREFLLLVPPYNTLDTHLALRIAGGLVIAAQSDYDRLNIVRTGTSASTIDLFDAVHIARVSAGFSP
jgi:hypothetical protein